MIEGDDILPIAVIGFLVLGVLLAIVPKRFVRGTGIMLLLSGAQLLILWALYGEVNYRRLIRTDPLPDAG
jgi:hypothetical protein